jgi:hypothetical protein
MKMIKNQRNMTMMKTKSSLKRSKKSKTGEITTAATINQVL